MTQSVTRDDAAPVFRQGDIVTFKFHPLYRKPLPTGFSYGVVVDGNHALRPSNKGITVFPLMDRPANLSKVPGFGQLEEIDLAAIGCAQPAWTRPVLPEGRFVRPDLAVVIGRFLAGVEPADAHLPPAVLRYSLDQFSRLIAPGEQPQELFLCDYTRYDENHIDRSAVVALTPYRLSRQTGTHMFVRLLTNPATQRPEAVILNGFHNKLAYTNGNLLLAAFDSFAPWKGAKRAFVAPEKMWEIRSNVLNKFGIRAPLTGIDDIRPVIAGEKEMLAQPMRPFGQLTAGLAPALQS